MGSPLQNYLQSLARGLRKRLAVALAGEDVRAVHEVRVITRRLNVAIECISEVLPAKSGKRLGKALRKIRGRVGPLRDLDVMLQHLRASSPGRNHAAAGKWLLEAIESRRDELGRKMARSASPRRVLAVMEDWLEFVSTIDDSNGALAGHIRMQVKTQLGEFDEQASKVIHSGSGSSGDAPAHPHVLRIAGKRLRYTLELAGAVGLKIPASAGRDFKRLQDTLGLWHDFLVLSHENMRQAIREDVAVIDPILFGGLLDLSRHLLKRSERYLHRFSVIWNQVRNRLMEGIEEAIGLPGVTGSPEPAGEELQDVTPAESAEESATESSGEMTGEVVADLPALTDREEIALSAGAFTN